MKIAFVVGEFPNLSETFVINQIAGLVERGHDVDIYADKPGAYPKVHPDVEKYNLLKRTYYDEPISRNFLSRPFKSARLLQTNLDKHPALMLGSLNVVKHGRRSASLRLLHQIIPHLNKPSYDIIHCQFGGTGLKSLLLRDFGLLRGRLITAFHGSDLTKELQQKQGERRYERLFEKGDLFLPISKHWKDKLIELGCDEKKIVVHHMGVDCSSFSFTPRRLLTNGKVRLVSINRLVEKKGVEYGIRAVAKLTELHHNIEYNIVGDGPLKGELQQLIKELKVGNSVKLLGWRHKSEVIEILNNSDILIAPSVTSKDGDREGIPVTIMEAMAMGLPVVSTLHSGIPELVENGVSGFLVPERDVAELAQKLSYLIEHPQSWSEMGRLGRLAVEKEFNIATLSDHLVGIYENLLTDKYP